VPLDNSLYRHPLFREFLELPKELGREIRTVGSGVIVDAVFSCPMTRPLDTRWTHTIMSMR
jgi:serine protease Do